MGLVFKREFDNIFSFLRRRKDDKKDEKEQKESNDEEAVPQTESVLEKRKRIPTDSIFDGKSGAE